MIQQFVDDDAGYFAWLGQHPAGFVLKTYREPTPGYVRLHRATCYSVTRPPANGSSWTHDYRKTCADTRAELEAWARGEVLLPKSCAKCNP